MITKEMFFEAFKRHDKGEQYKDIAKSMGVSESKLASNSMKSKFADMYLSLPDTPLSALNGFHPERSIDC